MDEDIVITTRKVSLTIPIGIMLAYLAGQITRREYWVATSVWFGTEIPDTIKEELWK